MIQSRWIQLFAGVVGMVAVANLQYGWTLFVEPMRKDHGWSLSDVQLAFTLFVLAETWLVPFETFLADRVGPRPVLFAGGFLAASAWAINAQADSLGMLYAGNVMAGMGAGMVYGVCIGNALKWFPDRRGLAAGITAAAWGAGTAVLVSPMRAMIADPEVGYAATFLRFGLGQGLVVFGVALVLRAPPADVLAAAAPRVLVSTREASPLQMLRSPAFWLVYVMMTMVSVGGLMAVPNVGTMAKSLHVADSELVIWGYTFTALTLALQLERILNGFTRPFFGWISDNVGRELTMGFAFTLEGLAILLWLKFAHVPLLFVLLSGVTFFAWGEVFSLFPALLGDMFGRRYATTNYAILYTAKGTASLFVYLGAYLYTLHNNWLVVFSMAIAFDWITALLALFVLRPLRRRWAEAEKAVAARAMADKETEQATPS